MPKSNEDKLYWRGLWRSAFNNMPRQTLKSARSAYVLLSLLGYKVTTGYASSSYVTKMLNGHKPNTLEKQVRLKALAGPNGSTMARVIAIQKNFDLTRYKVWQ
jgi:hypothetical protein